MVIPAICDLEKERGLKMEEEGREGGEEQEGPSLSVGRMCSSECNTCFRHAENITLA